MAVASERVTATAIEATEFPELARSYRVMAVPKIVINDRVEFEGALPEPHFLDAVLRAVSALAGGRRPPSAPARLLFAYGTLMRGYPLHRVLARGAAYLGPGNIRGALLDLGAYPGLVEGRGAVTGEVYRLDASPELLPALDREEGYNFERRRRRIV